MRFKFTGLIALVVALFAPFAMMAQAVNVSGTVTSSEDGLAMPGVSIIVVGTTTGTSTDFDGNFSIDANEGDKLQFSFIGYSDKTVAVSGSSMNVVLNPDAAALDEVVVTAVGITREKKALGYSVTSVGSEELSAGAPMNAMDGLKGKVAGVSISNSSGAPGSSTKVILRGYSSIGGNNQPLYVVDGSPINNSSTGSTGFTRSADFGNGAQDINPDDIANVSILKGASATALYGSRAANGVILITTKKGSKGKVSVNYSGSFDWSNPLRLPEFQNKYGQGWSGHWATDENGSWGPKFDGSDRWWGNTVDGERQYKKFSAVEDNMKDFYETGFTANNSLSFGGGNENSKFYVSLSNVNSDGIVPTDADSFDRTTFGVRGEIKNDWIKISSNLNYVTKKQKFVATGQGDAAGGGAVMFQEIMQVPRDLSIVDMKDYNNKFYDIDNFYTPYAQNPYFSINENGNNYKSNRVYGNIAADLTLAKNLNLTYRFGADITNSMLQDWGAKAIPSADSPNSGTAPIAGLYLEESRKHEEYNQDLVLNYNTDVTEDINIGALAGMNINERKYKRFTSYVTDLDLPGYYNLKNSSAPPTSSSYESTRRLIGAFAQVDFAFRNFFFVSAVARNDWSSTLPSDNNSFFYPGVNTSIVISDAVPAVKDVFDFLKVRASWGMTGNDADPYLINSVFVPAVSGNGFGQITYPFGGVNAYSVSDRIGNAALQPEITSEVEFGIDVRFFESRVGIDVSYYNKTTTDQILNTPLSPSSGFTQQTMNFGKVNNQGIELVMNLVPVRTDDFNWDMTYTFSKNTNEVVELSEEFGIDKVTIISARGIQMVAEKGKPIGTLYGPKALTDGDGHVVVNAAGMPVAHPDDLEELGSINSDFMMGLINNFRYKNLSLSFAIDWRQGGKMFSYTENLTGFVGNSVRTLYNDRKPFIVPNSVQKLSDGSYVENVEPVTMQEINSYNYDSSNKLAILNSVVDRSYIKLRDVTLSYELPKSMANSIYFSRINVAVYGRNLWLWTPATNTIIDPESSTFGNDLGSEFGEYAVGPTVRSYGFSVKLGL